MDAWIRGEIDRSLLPDVRLRERLGAILQDLADAPGSTLPAACQDWAATKAAYRFLDNGRVDEAAILAGHFQATRARTARAAGTVLILHDTTEFSYRRTDPQAIGILGKTAAGKLADGRPRMHTTCGILLHSSMVVTLEGLPLGLAAAKFWTRKKFKGANALRGKVNATRIPIEQKESYRWIENLKASTTLLSEPERCVHVGDRESDIFELFCAASDQKTYFLVRTCVDRLAEDGDVTIAAHMDRKGRKGIHRLMVRDLKGRPSRAKLEVRYCTMTVQPPIGKQRRYPSLTLTAIHAREIGTPKDRDPIDWKLLTNLPIPDLDAAVEKLRWYAMRWKIETYHKVLKSGYRAEQSKLRTAQRLTNLLAVYCILAWRIFWLCMLNRVAPDDPGTRAFTATELALLHALMPMRSSCISNCLLAVAKLGGYLARANDPPPGNMVLWRGMARLTDIHFGFLLGKQLVGN